MILDIEGHSIINAENFRVNYTSKLSVFYNIGSLINHFFSMEGSPRMISTPQFQPVTTPSNNPSVSLGKKTIRNYTPKESSNMLREFEDRRNNSVDYRSQSKHNQKKPSKPSIERKSSMDRLIDDFHR